MKTYSGELKDGMPVVLEDGIIVGETNQCVLFDKTAYCAYIVEQVYHNNEWKLYKPQPKKVWGVER